MPTFILARHERQAIADAMELAAESYRDCARTAHDDDEYARLLDKARALDELIDCVIDGSITYERAPLP